MYVLVLIAYMSGEVPLVRTSPSLYHTYDDCVYEAADVMTLFYNYLPDVLKDEVIIAYTCTAVSKDA